MSDDLVKRLSLLADSIELGDKLRWGEDSAALREAKDRIEELEAQITAMKEGLTAVHMAGYMDGKKAAEDDLVQAAVAAALREVAALFKQDALDMRAEGDTLYWTAENDAKRILALITEDAQAALDRYVKQITRSERSE